MNLSSNQIQKLLKSNSPGSKISIYLPTHPSSNSQTITQDTTRFKNALKNIKNNTDYDERELGKVVKSLYQLAEDIEFWKHRDVGLAIFASKRGYEHYSLSYEFVEASYLQDQFVISPIAIMRSIGSDFYVLDVNLTRPRLLQSDHGTLAEINGDKMPSSFQETMAREEYKPELQHKAAPRGSDKANMFHGHDVSQIVEHDVIQYLLLLATTIDKLLDGEEQPLLLMGEQNRVGNMRSHIKYEHLLASGVDGNFEAYSPQKLYNVAAETIQDYDSKRRQEIIKQLTSSPPELVVIGDAEIIKAAQAGRVARMYIPAYRRTTDSVRSGESELIVVELPKNIDKLEAAVRTVVSQAGQVQAIRIDTEQQTQQAKALCRF